MPKYCEVEGCGRILKTGRKYCYEHRNTASSESVRKDNLIKSASKGYIRNKLGWFWLLIYRYWLIFVIAFGMLPVILGNSYWFLFLILIVIILRIIVFFKIHSLKKVIDNRHPEYVSWVKGWSQFDREEKEYKKSLLE